MERCLLKSLVLLSVLAVFAANLCAQGNFLFTNNNPAAPNTVSAYSVAADGSLTAVAGSPFMTGGAGNGGGFFAANRLAIVTVGNFLYVTNDGNNTVSGFSVDPGSGVLTGVPGSPFPTGGTAGGFGISLGATPDGSFLFAANGDSSNIRAFAIDPDTGTLTPTGPLVPSGGNPDGIRVTPDGNYLLLALPGVGPNGHGSVAVFSISGGTLTAVVGSPFQLRGSGGEPGSATGVDVNCASDTAFVGEASNSTTVDVASIDSGTGVLTPIAGSPFVYPGVGSNANVALLSPDETLVFSSNQNTATVTVSNVASDHTLTLNGLPAFVGDWAVTPSGEATDQAGAFLYVADFPAEVSVFTIGSDGSLALAPGSPVPLLTAAGIESLAAFPPKSCSAAAARR